MMNPNDYVLVVEDVEDEREAVRLTLELEGYNVVAVATGDEGLAHMRGVDPVPRLILLDLKMHGTNGWDFRIEQLQEPRLARVPVLVCSGDGRLAEKAHALGVKAQLPKPIDQKALLALVATHC
jgi:CheY-like chemotaxis protein